VATELVGEVIKRTVPKYKNGSHEKYKEKRGGINEKRGRNRAWHHVRPNVSKTPKDMGEGGSGYYEIAKGGTKKGIPKSGKQSY